MNCKNHPNRTASYEVDGVGLCSDCSVNLVDMQMDRGSRPFGERVLQLLNGLTHPIQYKIVLKACMQWVERNTPPEGSPTFMYNAIMSAHYGIMGAWFAAFEKQFNRPPYPAEVHDPRGMPDGYDFEAESKRDSDTLAKLNLPMPKLRITEEGKLINV